MLYNHVRHVSSHYLPITAPSLRQDTASCCCSHTSAMCPVSHVFRTLLFLRLLHEQYKLLRSAACCFLHPFSFPVPKFHLFFSPFPSQTASILGHVTKYHIHVRQQIKLKRWEHPDRLWFLPTFSFKRQRGGGRHFPEDKTDRAWNWPFISNWHQV